jgi:8-oxo-dGTP pyrophosphatase MutT (NUDIX family)
MLIEEGKILFIHHLFNNPALFGKWTFPGGRLNPDEIDPLITLHREMREELSVEVEVIGEVGVFYSRSGADYTIFAARPLGPLGPIQADEIKEIAWLTPAEVYEWHTKEKLQFGFELDVICTYLKTYSWP